jgi:DNA invertase Pin-like site-specific DNA recombinase
MAEGRKRVAFYVRVSTGSQNVENQRRELQEVADRAGWEVVAVYQDEGISGTKGRDRRPQFDAMLKAATRRKFDMIAAWSLDRLGRSLQDLVAFLSELRASGTDLFLHKQALDTSTAAGKAMFGMVSVFAEFEADIIKERVKAGLARARAQGKRLGRRPVADAVVQRIQEQLATGAGIIKTAKAIGCGVGTVHRIKREMAAVAA